MTNTCALIFYKWSDFALDGGLSFGILANSDDSHVRGVFISALKETKSATMNIFLFFYFLFKSFVKVELSYVFTINLFTIAENCTEN